LTKLLHWHYYNSLWEATEFNGGQLKFKDHFSEVLEDEGDSSEHVAWDRYRSGSFTTNWGGDGVFKFGPEFLTKGETAADSEARMQSSSYLRNTLR
jgi:hypothetical protein